MGFAREGDKRTLYLPPLCIVLFLAPFIFHMPDISCSRLGNSSQKKWSSIFELQAIRVIANLSINEEAGAGIAANEPFVDLLIQILGKLTFLS